MRRPGIQGPRGRALFAEGRSNLNFECASLWRFGNSGGARDPETRNRQIRPKCLWPLNVAGQ